MDDKDVGDAPSLVQWYRRNTDGLTRQHVRYGVVLAFVVWCFLAVAGWCNGWFIDQPQQPQPKQETQP